jgi:hypothetical protein
MGTNIVGLHLGGAHTKKSAVVRGSLEKELATGRFYFLLNMAIGNIGVTKHRDADTRLMEIVSDLMPFDVLCIDSATSLPPCTSCLLACPGVPLCQVQEVNFMKLAVEEELQNKTKEKGKGRHTRYARMPQPYLERGFELKLRSSAEYSQVKGNLDLEPVLGSNRAPLSMRSMRFLKEFKHAFPNVTVQETPSLLACQGISQHVLNTVPTLSEMKDFRVGKNLKSFRGELVKKLLANQTLVFGSSVPGELRADLVENFNEFLALVSALVPWANTVSLTKHVNNYYYFSKLFSETELLWPIQH